MIRLPARPDGVWSVQFSNSKLPDLVGTRNISFEDASRIRLSKPTIMLYSENDDADFGNAVGIGRIQLEGQYMVCTSDAQFTVDMRNGGNYGTITVAQDTNTNSPINADYGYYEADVAFFGGELVYGNPGDKKMYRYDLSSLSNSWTVSDTSASLDDNHFALSNFIADSQLAVGNENSVDLFNTSYSADTPLAIPDDLRVTGVAYNNNYLGITTHHRWSGRAIFYIWDGKTAAANYAVELSSTSSFMPTPYKDSFVFLDGNGVLNYWTGASVQELATLPSNSDGGTFLVGPSAYSNPFTAYNHAITTDGDKIFINIKSVYLSRNENFGYFNEDMPGGIWCYDPKVGLHHRHAPTGVKVVQDTIATTAVDTSTDEITVAASPETGTPVRYSDGTGTGITGLTNRQVYYTIKVDATTVMLAETYSDAVAGTQIDLTGTGNNNQTLQFYPKTDFGQSFIGRLTSYNNYFGQGFVHLEKENKATWDLYYDRFFYGSNNALTGTTEYSNVGFALQDTENRGNFTTALFQSSGLQDDWQKLYLKHSKLTKDLDKIIVKYRTQDDGLLVKITSDDDGKVTWSDENTFTSTDPQFANVAAGDEVEIIQGTGSGYLAHVSSISESSGTYTVNIDEDIKNLTASDTGRVVVSRWTKLNEISKDTVRNTDGYSEINLGIRSKTIQFKIELRGEDIEIEELLVANTLYKPV